VRVEVREHVVEREVDAERAHGAGGARRVPDESERAGLGARPEVQAGEREPGQLAAGPWVTLVGGQQPAVRSPLPGWYIDSPETGERVYRDGVAGVLAGLSP